MNEDAALLEVSAGSEGGSGDSSAAGGNNGTQVVDSGDNGGERTEQHDDLDLSLLDDDGAEQKQREEQQRREQNQEEPEVSEFKGIASSRLQKMVKDAPELAAVFKKYPQVKDRFEGIVRRDAAYRDVFATVAEARALREALPGGKQDLDTLMEDVNDLATLDNMYDDAGQDGSYPGHEEMIKSFFERDKTAAVSLLKRIARMWPQLDGGSYQEVGKGIVAATLTGSGIVDMFNELSEIAESVGDENITKSLNKLTGRLNYFFQDKPKPTREQEELDRQRKDFEKQRGQETEAKRLDFRKNVISQARTSDVDMIKKHPAVSRMLASKSISNEKKNEILNKIWHSMTRHLASSPAFSRKFNAAHARMDLQTCLELRRAAVPQVLTRMVRNVLSKEVPSLVSRKPAPSAGARGAAPSAKPGERRADTPKGPKQIAGRWYKGDGTPFTSAEVLAGKHLQ